MKKSYNWLKRLFRRKSKVGTFDKWVFPVIANMSSTDDISQILAVQPMTGPTKNTMKVSFVDATHPYPKEFWRPFIDGSRKPPFNYPTIKSGYFRFASGKYRGESSCISNEAITHVLKVPDPQELVEAWVRYGRAVTEVFGTTLLPQTEADARAKMKAFADQIQPNDVVCNYKYGGILAERSGLAILRKQTDGSYEVVDAYQLWMS